MYQESVMRESGMACVKCGGNGTEGSLKHPYCKECFKEVWDNDSERYLKWLEEEHS